MVLVAAALFGVNGTVAKVALSSGLTSLRLTEVRCAGAFVGLTLLALTRGRSTLRLARREVVPIVTFGVVGVALVQLFYFLSIHRLAIAIALQIQ
jgi:drug/metabolite transporter (DMT)-like permease